MVFTALFLIIWYIPSSWLPDKVEDSFGGEYDLPPSKKREIKLFALYFVGTVGLLYCGLQYYFYSISKKWAKMEFLINQVNRKKAIESRMKTTTARSTNARSTYQSVKK